jgi:hypothetical protein
MPLDSSASGTWLGESFTFYGDHVEWCVMMAASVIFGLERATGFAFDDILRKARKKKGAKIGAARKAVVWLLREVAELTFSAIARLLDRDRKAIHQAHASALADGDSRKVIEAVLARRRRFEVIEPAHGGVKVF